VPDPEHQSDAEEVAAPDDWGEPLDAQHRQPEDQLRFSPAYRRDRHFYRVVAWSLALLALLALIGTIVLVVFGREVPDAVVAIGSTAAGALAGVVTGDRL
jgi:hypothetical protein